jgi:hypothetical protein
VNLEIPKSGTALNHLYLSRPETVHADLETTPVRNLILSGMFGPCAYVGLPIDHPMAGLEVELNVHGGITWSGSGADRPSVEQMADRWWWGWDYCHSGDRAFGKGLDSPGRVYSLSEILTEATEAASELIDLSIAFQKDD